MRKNYFISGIDTSIGKTFAVGMMARFLRKENINAITFKLVQTGNEKVSEDIQKHRELMECGFFPEDEIGLTCPQIFSFPASPHLAAEMENKTINLDIIHEAVLRLENIFETVLIEGAGGLAVPLNEDLLTIDFAAKMKWPLILVTSGRLGSLNHTIMSIECAASRNMHIAGVVFNYCSEADEKISLDSKKMIKKYLKKYNYPEILVELPEVNETIIDVDFSEIFNCNEVKSC